MAWDFYAGKKHPTRFKAVQLLKLTMKKCMYIVRNYF